MAILSNRIKENRIQVNKYFLQIQPGIPNLTVTSLSGLAEELDAAELPDRTMRSGGRKKSVEFEITTPQHHDTELLLLEAWYTQCSLSLPGYLRQGVLAIFDDIGIPRRKYLLQNVWIKQKGFSDLELGNEGDMAEFTWTMQCDQILPAG